MHLNDVWGSNSPWGDPTAVLWVVERAVELVAAWVVVWVVVLVAVWAAVWVVQWGSSSLSALEMGQQNRLMEVVLAENSTAEIL